MGNLAELAIATWEGPGAPRPIEGATDFWVRATA